MLPLPFLFAMYSRHNKPVIPDLPRLTPRKPAKDLPVLKPRQKGERLLLPKLKPSKTPGRV